MHAPRFFQFNLGLTSLGFATLSASRIIGPNLAKRHQSTLEGVGIALIGAGEAVRLVRGEREFQRAAERAKTNERALNRLAAKIETVPRITRADRRKAARTTKLKDVKVAAILDEFSFNSFAPECKLLALTPENWRYLFDHEAPDLFFCESAWAGHDPQARPWRGKIYASENFAQENRAELLEILEYCKRAGVPTVFWNKEDPSHFDDRAHNFVDTAIKFDHIFTTDAGCVPRYKEEYGHRSVHVLQFAAQPKLFNPIEVTQRSNDAVFAGGWYENHIQRSKDMEQIFDAVLRSGRGLKIYDRYFNFEDDDTHVYPESYAPFIHPPVPGDQMASVYKESNIGININTETQSETMFARRVFELMACNTFVVSNYSKGVDALLGDTVLFLDREPNGLESWSQKRIDASREHNLHTVLREHTYAKRFEEIARVAGLDFAPSTPAIAATALVTDKADTEHAFAALRSLSAPNITAKVLLVGPSVEPFDYGLLLRDFNRDGVQVIRLANDAPRGGEVLRATDADYFYAFKADECPSSVEAEGAIAALLLHAQYSPCAVAFAQQPQQRYSVVSEQLRHAALIPAVNAEHTLSEMLNSQPVDQLLIG